MSEELYYQTSVEDRERLQSRVEAGTLPDTIRFTERPLESLVELPEDAKASDIVAIIAENKRIAQRNDDLCRAAKSLRALLLEAPVAVEK